MSVSTEQLILDYQTKRRNLEDEEDQLKYFKKQGEQEVEQFLSELDISLRNQEIESQEVGFIRQEIFKAQEVYDELLAREKKKLLEKLEDNELDYRQKLKQIN